MRKGIGTRLTRLEAKQQRDYAVKMGYGFLFATFAPWYVEELHDLAGVHWRRDGKGGWERVPCER